MVVSKKTKERWAAQWSDPRWQESIIARVAAQKADPLPFSQLPYWLGLEVWTRDEGLYVLTGVEPGTVEREREHELGSSGPWVNAMPFAEHISFFQLPDPAELTLEDHRGDEPAFESYLQGQEKRTQTLRGLERLHDSLAHKLEHSPSALGDPVGYRSGSFHPSSTPNAVSA